MRMARQSERQQETPGATATMGGMREQRWRATTPGLALRRHPVRLLFTPWPWRSLAYVLSTPLVAAVWLVSCWPLLTLAGVSLGHVERHRLRLLDYAPIPTRG